MLIFVGTKEKCKPEIFESEKIASTSSHPQFNMVFVPFRSRKDAENCVQAMEREAWLVVKDRRGKEID